MPKRKRLLGGALLTAAATALTVKGTLDTPIGAAVTADELQHDLGASKDAVLTWSTTLPTKAQQRLVGAIVEVPSPSPAPTSNGQLAAVGFPAHEAPEPRAQTPRLYPHKILREAAQRHQLEPKLILALSYWESGWDQSRVSQTGAIGLMQVEPATAQEAGPALLGRPVDVNDPYDNADVGTAVLKQNIDTFHDVAMALAAYYQGPASLRASGMFPDTQQYVQGILDLAARMDL